MSNNLKQYAMNYDQTLEQMRSLRLHGMAQALGSLLEGKKVST
jgi:hypothetical protein